MIYYFDTSIWLDFFEDRDEPTFPKSTRVHILLDKIVKNQSKIIISDHVIFELSNVGYSKYELSEMLSPLRSIVVFIESTEKQFKKAKDLAAKRNIPKGDALHALIARDAKALLVTFDRHFQKIKDIGMPYNPNQLI